MKDLFSKLLPFLVMSAAVRTATANGATVDLNGFQGVLFQALVGIGGITFTTTNKISLVMEESDNDSDWSAVDGADIQGASSVANGIVKAIVAEHAAGAVYNYGYLGSKRYVRLNAVYGGTHSTGTPIGIVAVKGNPLNAPVQ
jgi:energy-converting hydrogenase Eha subunit H